jgi:hypothetical protein
MEHGAAHVPAVAGMLTCEACFTLFLVANGRLVEDDVLWQRGYLEIFARIGAPRPA